MAEIVWAVNPKHDTLDSMADYLCQFARNYLESSTLRCRLDVPAILPKMAVPSNVRHNLVLFVKEAVHNAVKHAQARELWLKLNVADNVLTLTIADDGQGFAGVETSGADDDSQLSMSNSRSPGNGNGLPNMRRRVEAIGGQLEIESQPGQGTQLVAAVPLKQDVRE